MYVFRTTPSCTDLVKAEFSESQVAKGIYCKRRVNRCVKLSVSRRYDPVEDFEVITEWPRAACHVSYQITYFANSNLKQREIKKYLNSATDEVQTKRVNRETYIYILVFFDFRRRSDEKIAGNAQVRSKKQLDAIHGGLGYARAKRSLGNYHRTMQSSS